ncbi:MAG: surface lipoprotein assembly modifier [Defluviicoccus sp.]|nr:surface lipoprotein assembly modifier [Defluviicoccus sp.]MDE0278579.1 surface lipoprotein assembly modifier [Defluviicoccus sp.]
MDRYTRSLGAMFLALFFATSLPGGAVGSQAPPRPELSAGTLIEAARKAIARGNLDDAAFLLKGVNPGEDDIDAVDFLWGTIAAKRGDWREAIARFRAMLARNPDLPRVRLDLAFVYFQAGEDRNAAYHFRLALGTADLPEIARARALAFLDRIRRRKTWSVTGSFAVLPDSNINNATGARSVELFGLPATLSDDARRTSGVGVSANLSGGYEARLASDLRFRVGGGLRTRTYREDRFDERILSLRAGPRILFEKFDLRPELTMGRRWLGGEVYNRTVGAALSGSWLIGDTWRLGASLGREWVDYRTFLGEGSLDSAGLNLAHALGRATQVRVQTTFRRERLDRDAYSWREAILGISVSRELPWGFVVSGGPSYRWREYGAPLHSLGPDARRDRTLAGRITVSNRSVELFGFMPEVTVRHERRTSNLALYDYRRTAGELGVVRSF